MKSDISGQRLKRKRKKGIDLKWIITIFFSTVLISAAFSSVSGALLEKSDLFAAFVILLVIILIGILFDVIGVAVTAADAKPFHSMAAHKTPGAQEALTMLRHADKVSSFCNDVVGDICGVISGTASAAIVVLILTGMNGGRQPLGLEIAMAALVSGLTVGGKAVGKTVAMRNSTQIVHITARGIYYVKYAPQAVRKLVSQKK